MRIRGEEDVRAIPRNWTPPSRGARPMGYPSPAFAGAGVKPTEDHPREGVKLLNSWRYLAHALEDSLKGIYCGTFVPDPSCLFGQLGYV